MRQTKIYELSKPVEVKDFKEFETVMLLNSNGSGKNLLALGSKNEYLAKSGGQSALNVLNHCTKKIDDWLFGYVSYDLKNSLEQLESDNDDYINAPLFHFWQPLVVFEWDEQTLNAHYITLSEAKVDELVNHLLKPSTELSPSTSIKLKPKISKEEYLDKLTKLKQHIQNGDVYELNFCQEFFAENVSIDGFSAYRKLNNISRAPYSSYLKDLGIEVMSASPELFLKKNGDVLKSSPIKGTAKRGVTAEEDEQLKSKLKASKKEQSENIMIVDLVRNDLSKIASPSTVQVDELMELHSFPTVHQLISTVSAKLKPETTFLDVVKATFPMGSMTGAPKIAAMQLAEHYESTKRGLYSGAIGFFRPDGDYTFNVVIRTLQYNAANKYLSLMAGGAITHQSVPEEEYQESLLKAEAIVASLKA